MSLPSFNQKNVDAKINEIEKMSSSKKQAVTDEIRNDLTEWLKSQFSFTDNYSMALDNMPTSLKKEYGYTIALALQERNWSLKVVIPPGEPNPRASGWCPSSQEVSGEWDPVSGEYTVSKTVTWEF